MKKLVKILWTLVLGGMAVFLLLILLINWGWFGYMPSLEELENPSAALASEVYAADGTPMGKFYYADQDRTAIDYKDISPYVTQALIGTEDRRFYEHSGIDPKGVAAIPFYLLTGRKRGSSTITQQLALNLFGTRSPNFVIRAFQKLKEWVLAVKLERNFTKQEILALYLNTVPYSDNVYGIKNASRTFFSKNPDRLNIQESATLIGMVNAPTLYNPRRNPRLAIGRRNLIISNMERSGFITEAQARAAENSPIELQYHKMDQNAGIAPYCREFIRSFMKKWCADHKKNDGTAYNLYTDGLKIYTTINPLLQLYARQAVEKHLAELQKTFNKQYNIKKGTVWKGRDNYLNMFMKQSGRYRAMKESGMKEAEIKKFFLTQKVPVRVFAWNHTVGNLQHTLDTTMTPMDSIKYMQQVLQAGFLSMDPESGEIKAWVGGPDFRYFKNDHINTRRQVGSTIKPFLYCLAVMNGFSPNTPVPNEPVVFPEYNNWVSRNDDGGSSEEVLLSTGLAQSLNNVAAYLIKQLTPAVFADFLNKRIRISSDVPPYPSIALGTPEISLYEMMRGYSIFPDKGLMAEPILITRIEDRNGNIVQNFSPKKQEIINQNTAFSMIELMQGVVNHGTGYRMRSRYGLRGPMAGKTGTTNDNTDGWFIGYVPQLQFGAWVGCDYNFLHFSTTAIGQGANTGLPICAYFLQKVYADKSLNIDADAQFVRPPGMPVEVMDTVLINNTPNALPGVAPQDVGNGSASDYFDVGSDAVKPAKETGKAGQDAGRQTKPSSQNKNEKRIPKAIYRP